MGNARQAREVMHCADVDSSTRVFIAAFEHFAALNPAMELDVCKECAPARPSACIWIAFSASCMGDCCAMSLCVFRIGIMAAVFERSVHDMRNGTGPMPSGYQAA